MEMNHLAAMRKIPEALRIFRNIRIRQQSPVSKIDAVNKKISGTFQFTGVRFKDFAGTSIETKVFTNGSFTDIPFTDDNLSLDTDVFYAKLDGTEFVEDGIDVAEVVSSGVTFLL